MSASVGNLAVVLSATTEPMVQDLKKGEAALTNFGKHADSLGNNNFFEKFNEGAEHFVKHLMSAGLAIVGISSAFSMLERGMELAEKAEMAHISFKLLTGDIKIADELLAELKKTGSDLGVSFGDLRSNAQQMLKFGFDAKDINPILKIITNYGLALGDVKGTTEGLIQVFGALRDKPAFDSRSMRAMIEFGIQPWESLSRILGKTKAEVKEMLDAGMIDVPTGMKAVLETLAKKGEGGAAEVAETLGSKKGRIGRLMDSGLKKVGEEAIGFFDFMLKNAGMMPSKMTNEGGDKLDKEVEKIQELKKAVDPATIAFEKFQKKAQEAIDTFGMSDMEKQLKELQKFGLSSEQAAQAQALVKQIENQIAAKKEQIEAEREFQQALKESVKEQQHLVAAITAAGVKGGLGDYLAKQKDITDLQKQANKLLEDSLSPREKMTQEVEKAKDAFLAGNLNEAEYMALIGKAKKDFDAAQHAMEPRFAGAAEAGSQEAYSAIISAQAGTNNMQDIVQKQLDKAVEQVMQTKKLIEKQGDIVAAINSQKAGMKQITFGTGGGN